MFARGYQLKPFDPKVRSVTLRTLVAAEFHARILANLRPGRKPHPGVCVFTGNFQTESKKFSLRGPFSFLKVRNVIALRTP